MTTEEYLLLYEKYLAGRCTPEEVNLLFRHRDDFQLQETPDGKAAVDAKRMRQKVYHRIIQTISADKPRVVNMRFWYAAAAAVLLIIISAALLLHENKSITGRPGKKVAVRPVSNIKPGSKVATLTLADGSLIRIDQSKKGILASQGKTIVRQQADGSLVYDAGVSTANAAALSMNTVSIPRAGHYSLVLPDGTRVWLNSESSLTFPASFSDSERKVSLKGEAYFEVTRDTRKPFRVEVQKISVDVLGTSFNIKSYGSDAAVYTTLADGAVRVGKGALKKVLEPGQQGVSSLSGDEISVRNVRVSDVIAWKKGLFVFRDNSVTEIMEQIARWYDVEVEYRGNVRDRTFGGVYSKNKDLAQLLTSMELTDLVHFKVEGRRIIVMP